MKVKHKVFIILNLVITVLYQSCSIDEVQPLNALTGQNIVRDEQSAQFLLSGIYAKWRGSFTGYSTIFLGIMGDELIQTGPMMGDRGIAENNVQSDNEFIKGYYSEMYDVINQANWLIEALEDGKAEGISNDRKKEMIAESKFHRAMAHFNLLRLFGQFYNMNSEYGIVVRTTPSKDIEMDARKNVQESYKVIIDDLIYAELNAPSDVAHYLVSKTTAKGLLSKVYLNAGDYKKSAEKALQVIQNKDGYSLEINYSDIFLKRFNSSEILFSPFSEGIYEGGSSLADINRTRYSESLRLLADMQVEGEGDLTGDGNGVDPRFAYNYSETAQATVNKNGKYPYPGRDYSGSAPVSGLSNYFLRMGEIYLVYAEAKARQVDGLNADGEAIECLKQIRSRVGLTTEEPLTKAELLKAIYNEKKLELFAENGERWFDIVRYDRLEDINASSTKPSIINEKKLILPIPKEAMAGNVMLKQNP